MGFHTMGCMGWKLDDHLIIFSIISWENIRKKNDDSHHGSENGG
jgi:hypothetical protein